MSEDKEDPEVEKPNISAKLVEALTAFYTPAQSLADSDDLKSTKELISEMNSMEEIYPYEVNKLMEYYGFKIYYDGKDFSWLLKEK